MIGYRGCYRYVHDPSFFRLELAALARVREESPGVALMIPFVRTRWELEAEGQFSLEGCIELAWMMGFIRYERQRKENGQAAGPGWVECDSGLPIRDVDVKAKYEARICAHTGIRVLEMDDDPHANPDTRLRDLLHEVGTQEDLPPFECSSQAAAELRAHHGDAVELGPLHRAHRHEVVEHQDCVDAGMRGAEPGEAVGAAPDRLVGDDDRRRGVRLARYRA